MGNTFKILIIFIAFTFLISVVAFTLSIISFMKTNKESFFNNAGDATKTGWYETLNRSCKPNLKKCVVKNNSGSYHYFCSKDCDLKEVKGKEIEEPMNWSVRYA
jgi:hypothetical protein